MDASVSAVYTSYDYVRGYAPKGILTAMECALLLSEALLELRDDGSLQALMGATELKDNDKDRFNEGLELNPSLQVTGARALLLYTSYSRGRNFIYKLYSCLVGDRHYFFLAKCLYEREHHSDRASQVADFSELTIEGLADVLDTCESPLIYPAYHLGEILQRLGAAIVATGVQLEEEGKRHQKSGGSLLEVASRVKRTGTFV